MKSIDEHFISALQQTGSRSDAESVIDGVAGLQDLFTAQAQSRHLDFAARWLQSRGKGYYTIGSAGHEGNAALGLLSRVEDPALLHYRSGGFYAARAAVAGSTRGIQDVIESLTSAAGDPMSGGRHKVFGHPDLHIIPQTSTIASHLPRAVGLAYALGLSRATGLSTPWPDDSVVICSFGDASANHSTAVGALNAAAYLHHRDIRCPVLFVCEDNGIGISTKTPHGWTEQTLSSVPGLRYWYADSSAPASLMDVTADALHNVRTSGEPAVLHLRTVRFMGHAGSDAEIAYRTRTEILADYDRDPLLQTALTLIDSGAATAGELLAHYEAIRDEVMTVADQLLETPRLESREAVVAPLAFDVRASSTPRPPGPGRDHVWRGRLPEDGPEMTLAQSINATLADQVAADERVLIFGEDVGVKGGVYGVTRGLRKRFGGHRVFDTLLDEQTILGTALGTALAGYLPVPEIQYLAYLHNAEDQLRGEAASLRFFSAGQYQNGMVVRIAGLAYQRGFGGHFHNDNSIAVLRDIPGIVVAVPSHPADAPGMLRECFELARQDGRVCVFLEPIALYHIRDLHREGDQEWMAGYQPPHASAAHTALGEVAVHGEGRDLLIVTFGNGVPMSRRAALTLAERGIEVTVLDMRWLAPLPVDALLKTVQSFGAVLVADETRRSGGVAESVVSELIDADYRGRISRVTSADTFIPLGPAAGKVLLSEEDIVSAAETLMSSAEPARSGDS